MATEGVCYFPRTRSALKNLENLITCSFCKQKAQNPCTLGGCEHIFCRDCCQNYLGGNCPVCNIPAPAKDAQVNRQLFNIVTLCQKLHSLLSDNGQEVIEKKVTDDDIHICNNNGRDSPVNPSYTSAHNLRTGGTKEGKLDRSKSKLKEFKQQTSETNNDEKSTRSRRSRTPSGEQTYKQSPKNRKTACKTDVIDERTHDGTHHSTGKLRASLGEHAIKQSPRTRKTFDRTDGIEAGTHDSTNKEHHAMSPPKTKQKQVRRKSFTGTKKSSNLPTEDKTQNAEISAAVDQTTMTQFFDYVDDVETCETPVFNSDGNKKVSTSKAKSSLPKENSKPELTNKVLRVRTPKNGHKKDAGTPRQSQKRRSSGILCEESLSTPKTMKNAVPRQSRSSKRTSTSLSPATPRQSAEDKCSGKTSSAKKIHTDPLLKKNAKGETPLQIAAIKGEVDKAKELLKAGADPNTRDNAGWTPLHEAVHHGSVEIAELLLDHGALINVPGVDNDTPLHDAVCNYKVDCVKLLVSRGASLTARNIFGLTPQDCASTAEMKSALKTQVTDSMPNLQCVDVLEYQQPCLLGTFLNRDQKIILQKCAVVLQAKVVEEFTPEVTHIILPLNKDGMCARTIKYLLGVLAGKWIVSMEWIQMCMDYGSRVCEEAFEIPGTSNNPDSAAAYKGRTNRLKQLPGLFDGCQFYFHGNFELPSPEKEELMDLVRTGGGHILTREPKSNNLDENTFTVPYHANPDGPLALCCIYVVHDVSTHYPRVRTARMCTVTPSWIMNSVGMFKLLDPS